MPEIIYWLQNIKIQENHDQAFRSYIIETKNKKSPFGGFRGHSQKSGMTQFLFNYIRLCPAASGGGKTGL